MSEPASGFAGQVAGLARGSEAVEAFCRRLAPRLTFDPMIDPADAMFAFARRLSHGSREMALLEYLRSGYMTFCAAESLLRARFGSAGPPTLLDFGCGHGRVTRFLAPYYPDTRIIAAEADPGAVRFVERFGVEARPSPIDPAAWQEGGQFAAVLAFSVFTHLPERTFRPWLELLWRCVEPGGVLVASTLDEAVLLPGRTMPASGLHFERTSESRVLELDDYGTSWTRESFVRQALDVLPGVARVERQPLGLWRLQDLWVVQKEGDGGGPAPTLLPDYRPGPVGFLESMQWSDEGHRLELTGWAADGAGQLGLSGRVKPELRISLEIDGMEVASAEPTDERADLEARGGGRGFGMIHDAADLSTDPASPGSLRSSTRLAVAVTEVPGVPGVAGAAGEDGSPPLFYPLYEGSLGGLELYLALAEQGELARRLQAQVAIFEASGFGRARRRWMAWKQRLGLG